MNGAFLELFRHKTWATLGLIELCPTLADEDLEATIPGTYGTVRATSSTSSTPKAATFGQ